MADHRARRLRKEATPAERLLWNELRVLDIHGTHFRPQAPIENYIADFCCHRAKLIVEIDGAQHGDDANIESDQARTAFLESRGYKVLRFWNHEVLQRTESVVETILAALSARFPTDPV